MKIGILSMQRIHNYGSFLQAFSLKMQFESRGHDVYFIDILTGRQIVPPSEEPRKLSLLSKVDKYFFKRIENYLLSKKMDKIHISDYEMFLKTEKKLSDDEQFDLVVIGSDEVFNATTPSSWGFSPQLFGDVKNAKHVVTYAASCGHTTFDDVGWYGITDEIRTAMQNLEHISVRDENTSQFVTEILQRTPTVHVDPVFISNFDKFIPNLPKRKPYMLVYAYSNRICDEKEISAIKQYATKHRLDILCVGMQQRWCNHNVPASAFELLAYVKGASCVVTDTFHGTVFSTKYNKRFVSLIRESNRNKLGGLLKQLELTSRIVDNIENFQDIMDAEIDYKHCNEYLKSETKKSYDYFDSITKLED